MGKGIGLILVLGLGAWALSKRAVTSVFAKWSAPVMTAEQAQAAAANPETTIQYYQEYLAEHPSAYDQIEQAERQIASGAAAPRDIMLFNAHLTAYAMYQADGGLESFDSFILYNNGMTPEYKAVINDAKHAIVVKDADKAIDSYKSNIYMYVEHLSDQNPLKQELLTRPEVQAAFKEAGTSPEGYVPVPVSEGGGYEPAPEPLRPGYVLGSEEALAQEQSTIDEDIEKMAHIYGDIGGGTTTTSSSTSSTSKKTYSDAINKIAASQPPRIGE